MTSGIIVPDMSATQIEIRHVDGAGAGSAKADNSRLKSNGEK